MSAKENANVPDELKMFVDCNSNNPIEKNMCLANVLGDGAWTDYDIERIDWIPNEDETAGRWCAILK
jgi:hypothetical protein